jgi:protein-S-isoprenylcysteine O-methyltransferase Ste14
MDVRPIIGYLWMAFALYWLISGALVKPAIKRQSAGSRAFHVLGTLAAFVLIFYTRLQLGPLDDLIVPVSPITDYIGLALTVAGLIFAVWARVYLGGNWSGSVTVKQDHVLIRGGPYAVVRHPIYTGILLAALGGAISHGRIRCFIGFALLVVVLRVKSRLEEQFMEEQFGQQYASYKRDVKALVPLIW